MIEKTPPSDKAEWIISFRKGGKPEFLTPFCERKGESTTRWLNRGLEKEHKKYEHYIAALEKLNNELNCRRDEDIENNGKHFRNQRQISENLSNMNAIIERFHDLLKKILEEKDEET